MFLQDLSVELALDFFFWPEEFRPTKVFGRMFTKAEGFRAVNHLLEDIVVDIALLLWDGLGSCGMAAATELVAVVRTEELAQVVGPVA